MRPNRPSTGGMKLPDNPNWSTETKRLGPELLVTTMHGIANGDFAERVLHQLKRELSGSPVDWIPDATGITKADSTLFKPASEVLRDFKFGGGRDVVAVIKNPMIVMAARTISFTSKMIGGAVIEVVESLDEAHRLLARKRQERLGVHP